MSLDNILDVEYTVSEAIPVIERFVRKNKPVLILGGPGIGKSDMVHLIAKRDNNAPVIDFRAGLYDPMDLKGFPDMSKDLASWKPSAVLPNESRDGPMGYLFLDEITNVGPQMQGALFQLILNRRIGDYQLPKGWKLIAAGNRGKESRAATRLVQPFANRFAHISLRPNVDDFCKWCEGQGYPAEFVAFHRFRGIESLFNIPTDPEAYAFPTPRSCASVADMLVGEDTSDLQMLYRIAAAQCGPGYATEFVGFLKTYRTIPQIEEIILNPYRAPVPSNEGSTMNAIASMLARAATKDNFKSILAYANRLPKEFEKILVMEAISRDQSLTFTADYAQWAKSDANTGT